MYSRSQAHAPVAREESPTRPPPGLGRSRQDRYGNGFLAGQLDKGAAEKDGGGHDPAYEAEGVSHEGHEHGTQPQASTIQKIKNPAPAVPGEQRREVLGVIILGRGVSPSALDSCERFIVATLSNRKDVQVRLKKEQAALVIIPRDKKMTDVPEFASLKGTQTFDGRMWDDVRGSGGMRVPSGLLAIGVPEENLVDAGTDTYAEGYSVGLHELAHAIHWKGLADKEREQITAMYEARKKANGPWTEEYGASNEWEYYAQATNCFFGVNDGIGQNGSEWLSKYDAPMFAFLVSVYGPAPAAKPAAGR
ncbi:hypothetical protein LBMAG42_52260 [Deltaproteobacteria bacterium]|nr:hypothetical protein LBMAG42_52260 [Deltaproteobacteria bacterium]